MIYFKEEIFEFSNSNDSRQYLSPSSFHNFDSAVITVKTFCNLDHWVKHQNTEKIVCLSVHKVCTNIDFHWLYSTIFCPYTGEYGSVKTHIIAYFMQCLWKLIGYKQNSVNKLIKRKVFTLCFNHWCNVYIVWVIHIEKGMSKTCLALKWSNEFFSDEI